MFALQTVVGVASILVVMGLVLVAMGRRWWLAIAIVVGWGGKLFTILKTKPRQHMSLIKSGRDVPPTRTQLYPARLPPGRVRRRLAVRFHSSRSITAVGSKWQTTFPGYSFCPASLKKATTDLS